MRSPANDPIIACTDFETNGGNKPLFCSPFVVLVLFLCCGVVGSFVEVLRLDFMDNMALSCRRNLTMRRDMCFFASIVIFCFLIPGTNCSHSVSTNILCVFLVCHQSP